MGRDSVPGDRKTSKNSARSSNKNPFKSKSNNRLKASYQKGTTQQKQNDLD